jgi:tRNA(fMet)-specific endonuclease VapC
VKYVLDTNTVSLLMRGDERVISRLAGAGRSSVFLPQPVIAEIAYGLERLPRGKRRDALQARFDLIRGELARAIWSDEVSEAFGRIKARLERLGRRIEDFDAGIAAHAVVAGAVLVTSDGRHMGRIQGLQIEDWASVPRAE